MNLTLLTYMYKETSHSSYQLGSNFEPPVWQKVPLNQQQGTLHHIPMLYKILRTLDGAHKIKYSYTSVHHLLL